MSYVKVVAMLKRRPGMSFSEFQDYYEKHHAELGRALPEMAYYVRRYLRPRPMTSFSQEADQDFDVLTEQWYATIEDYQRARERLADPALAQAIREDEDKLFDRSAMRVYLLEERHSDFVPNRVVLEHISPDDGPKRADP